MILIPLSVNIPLSQAVHCSVSPLFELAASLHVLAQLVPPRRFVTWAEEVRGQFAESLLHKEWEYFRPLIRCGIPDVFDPVQTRGVMSIEEQYSYILALPTHRFAASVQTLLNRHAGEKKQEPLVSDLCGDPDYVKGRFTLFLSTYRQLFFEPTWEKLLPLLDQEAEKIKLASQKHDSLLAYLLDISAAFSYDEETNTLLWNIPGPVREAQQLLLCPSYYYASPPRLDKTGKLAHLLYSVSER